jgi:hypothetical protein
MRISEKVRAQLRREFAASGGRGRAAKYSHKQLSAWSQRGGRPKGYSPKKGGKR